MSNLLPTSSTDPFTLVYCSLWDMLEAHTGFTGLVRVGNRIKFLGDRLKPTKQEITDTDLPEVCVEPDGVEPHLQATSARTLLVQKFKIVAASGNQRLDTLGPNGINAAIFPVAWEMLRAMIGWTSNLMVLTWPVAGGAPFVHLARPTGLTLALFHPKENRTILGWSAAWQYEVHLNLLSAAMAPA
jgi:hypothetical protein